MILLHQKFATLTLKAFVVLFNRSERGEVLKLLGFTERECHPHRQHRKYKCLIPLLKIMSRLSGCLSQQRLLYTRDLATASW